MSIRNNSGANPAPQVGHRGLMADMARWGVVFAPETGEGEGESPANNRIQAALDAKEKKDAEDAKNLKKEPEPVAAGKSPADDKTAAEAAAEAAAEMARLRAQLEQLGNLTPDELKSLRDAKAVADKAAADKAAADLAAEQDRLKKEGNWEALRQAMTEEHTRQVQAANEELTTLRGTVAAQAKEISDLLIGRSFNDSGFLANETVMTPAKARIIYGPHFEIEAGKIVPYDQPRGSTNRKPLVDAKGSPLAFDEAIKRIVEVDPDRDSLLKAKVKPGAGVAPSGAKAPPLAAIAPRGIAGIQAALEAKKAQRAA
jgi:hypothetical protein